MSDIAAKASEPVTVEARFSGHRLAVVIGWGLGLGLALLIGLTAFDHLVPIKW